MSKAKRQPASRPAIIANPPRPNLALLVTSIVAWCAWLGFLIWLAWRLS
jgi:hypothetical protein